MALPLAFAVPLKEFFVLVLAFLIVPAHNLRQVNRLSQRLPDTPHDLKAKLEDGRVTLIKLSIDLQEMAMIHLLRFDQARANECLRESARYRTKADEIAAMLSVHCESE